jgi:hypothetical protein
MADPPTDSISSIAFSSQADYLAVGSWDNSVRPVKYLNIVKYLSTRTGPNLRGDSVWPVTRKGNVPTPRPCFRGLLEQGTSEHSGPYVLSFMSLCRRETKSFLEEQTMLGECSTSQPGSRRRSRSTTRQLRLYDGLMHLRLGFWRRLAGIRPSKYVLLCLCCYYWNSRPAVLGSPCTRTCGDCYASRTMLYVRCAVSPHGGGHR